MSDPSALDGSEALGEAGNDGPEEAGPEEASLLLSASKE